MSRRDHIIQTLGMLVGAVLAGLLAANGLKLPPISIPAAPPPAEGKPIEMPAPKAVAPNAAAALGRIQFGNAGCTATIIGPRRADGRYDVLTASHCVSTIGQHGTMRLLDGRTVGLLVQAIDRTSDCCWCLTEGATEVYPFALLAERSPQPGSRIWHAGYGVDKPGNREEGTADALPDGNGQIRMTLSVSSGDSGGGICLTDSNEVVSCVCCTAARGARASVWGAGVESIRRLRPSGPVFDDWQPLEIPTRGK
jgi:hypothetical protein